eukprot:s1397_g8.t1
MAIAPTGTGESLVNHLATCSKAGTFSDSALTLGIPMVWGEGHFVTLPVILIVLRTLVAVFQASSLFLFAAGGNLAASVDEALIHSKPGQKVRLRALALNAADLRPLARNLSFEVMSPEGFKLIKTMKATDEYGVAEFTFPIAQEHRKCLLSWALNWQVGLDTCFHRISFFLFVPAARMDVDSSAPKLTADFLKRKETEDQSTRMPDSTQDAADSDCASGPSELETRSPEISKDP